MTQPSVSESLLQAILFEAGDESAGELAGLADEVMEDPRCRFVGFGSDDLGLVLFTVWDDEVAEEVEQGLRSLVSEEVEVRRLALITG